MGWHTAWDIYVLLRPDPHCVGVGHERYQNMLNGTMWPIAGAPAPRCLHTACRPTSCHCGLVQASSGSLLQGEANVPIQFAKAVAKPVGSVAPSPIGILYRVSWQCAGTAYQSHPMPVCSINLIMLAHPSVNGKSDPAPSAS